MVPLTSTSQSTEGVTEALPKAGGDRQGPAAGHSHARVPQDWWKQPWRYSCLFQELSPKFGEKNVTTRILELPLNIKGSLCVDSKRT